MSGCRVEEWEVRFLTNQIINIQSEAIRGCWIFGIDFVVEILGEEGDSDKSMNHGYERLSFCAKDGEMK